MILRCRIRGAQQQAHLEQVYQLRFGGDDPYSAGESELQEFEIVRASRAEREALRKAGFAIRDAWKAAPARPIQRAAARR